MISLAPAGPSRNPTPARPPVLPATASCVEADRRTAEEQSEPTGSPVSTFLSLPCTLTGCIATGSSAPPSPGGGSLRVPGGPWHPPPGRTGGPPESGRHVGGACWAPGDSCQGLPASARQPACSLCAPLPWEPASASRQSGWRGAFPFYAIWGLFLHSFPGLPASPPPRAQPSGHGPLCGMQRRLLPAMASHAPRSPAPPPSARVDSELHFVPSF